jgi:hypothetical protein
MLADLRDARLTGRRVALDLDERCDTDRLVGRVERVAVTGAFTVVGGVHVPLERVLAVA